MTASTLTGHLLELRKRLLHCCIFIGLLFLILLPFANELYQWLALPMLKHLPLGSVMIATGIASPLMAPIKLILVLAIILTIPFTLHQTWSFIAPGLYLGEKRSIWPILLSSVLLFYLGVVFAYFIVFPLIFAFFVHVAPSHIQLMPDINEYLNFTLKLFLAFGIAFEVPIAICLLVLSGMMSLDELQKKRPYVVVGAFILGMLLTPPDIISQILLAIPICILFELGLIFVRLLRTHATT